MAEADEETNTCGNCKREIPSVNFTIHSVHCSRNLRLCPVCKEPFPANLLNEHHEVLHKPLPCRQCGESVCGTDLEDHVRDSCGHTVKCCRFCELELPRRDLPNHENYCGTRTEQCSDCKEWVMIKYRQLHLQSNHGFIRLDDDPIPHQPRAEPLRAANIPKPTFRVTNILPTSGNQQANREGPKTVTRYSDNSTANAVNSDIQPTASSSHSYNPFNEFNNASNSKVTNINQVQKNTNTSQSNLAANVSKPVNATSLQIKNSSTNVSNSSVNVPKNSANVPSSSVNVPINSANVPNSFTNLTKHANTSNFNKNLNVSKPDSCSKSNIVPNNGQSSPSSSNMCPVSNINSVNGVKMPKRTNDQPQLNINGANGSKLCKDIASRGAVKKSQAPPPPPPEPQQRDPIREAALTSALNRYYDEQQQRQQLNAFNAQHGIPPVLSPLEKLEKLRKMDMLHNREVQDDSWKDRLRRPLSVEPQYTGDILGSNTERAHRPTELHAERRRRDHMQPAANGASGSSGDHTRDDLKNLKPMSPEEFAARFELLQLDGGDAEPPPRTDRFSEIKSSLHALRRGLNEVTAPYIANPVSPVTNHNYQLQNNNEHVPRRTPSPNYNDDEVQLPCEFCGTPVPAQDLVQHQTGCRPDLAQLPRRNVPPSPRNMAAPLPQQPRNVPAPLPQHPRNVPAPLPQQPRNVPPLDLYEDPVIPCEFCTESLPIYLIAEHQERCRLQNDDDYSD